MRSSVGTRVRTRVCEQAAPDAVRKLQNPGPRTSPHAAAPQLESPRTSLRAATSGRDSRLPLESAYGSARSGASTGFSVSARVRTRACARRNTSTGLPKLQTRVAPRRYRCG
jgi:hypothetical protein